MNIIIQGNQLTFNGKTYYCAIGKNGFSADKQEGDNCTPVGEYALREVLFRPDKTPKPQTSLSVKPIQQDDGWCDDINDKNYNKPVKLPYSARHENLWREDDIYDVIIPLGYNYSPVIAGKGSAIFMHVARPGYEGTEGCIALKLSDLLEVLQGIDKDSKIIISS